MVLHLGALSGQVAPVETSTGGGLLYQSLFGWLKENAFASAAMATILVFFQALFVNLFSDEFRLMGERNWFPGLFYALVTSALPDFLFVSSALVGITFIPFTLWRLYKAYQKPNVTDAIFDGALWIGVGSLFYPPVLILSLAAYAGFEVVRVLRFHERFVFLFGLFTPLFLGWLWFFWGDKGAEFRDIQWGQLLQFFDFQLSWGEANLLRTGLVLILLFLMLLGLGPLGARKLIHTQKYFNVLYWFLAVGLSTFFFQKSWSWEHFLILSCPIGILIAYAFHNIRTRAWAEGLHFTLLVLVLAVQYASYVLTPLYSIF